MTSGEEKRWWVLKQEEKHEKPHHAQERKEPGLGQKKVEIPLDPDSNLGDPGDEQ